MLSNDMRSTLMDCTVHTIKMLIVRPWPRIINYCNNVICIVGTYVVICRISYIQAYILATFDLIAAIPRAWKYSPSLLFLAVKRRRRTRSYHCIKSYSVHNIIHTHTYNIIYIIYTEQYMYIHIYIVESGTPPGRTSWRRSCSKIRRRYLKSVARYTTAAATVVMYSCWFRRIVIINYYVYNNNDGVIKVVTRKQFRRVEEWPGDSLELLRCCVHIILFTTVDSKESVTIYYTGGPPWFPALSRVWAFNTRKPENRERILAIVLNKLKVHW